MLRVLRAIFWEIEIKNQFDDPTKSGREQILPLLRRTWIFASTVMTRSVPSCLLMLLLSLTSLNDVGAYPKSDLIKDADGSEQELEISSWFLGEEQAAEKNDLGPQREALQKIQEVCVMTI